MGEPLRSIRQNYGDQNVPDQSFARVSPKPPRLLKTSFVAHPTSRKGPRFEWCFKNLPGLEEKERIVNCECFVQKRNQTHDCQQNSRNRKPEDAFHTWPRRGCIGSVL